MKTIGSVYGYGATPTLGGSPQSKEEHEAEVRKDLDTGPNRIQVMKVNNGYLVEANYMLQTQSHVFHTRADLFEALNALVKESAPF